MLLNFCRNRGRGLGARTKFLMSSIGRKLLGRKVLSFDLKLNFGQTLRGTTFVIRIKNHSTVLAMAI